MKITLKPLLRYQAFGPSGEELGVFDIGSDWQGMVQLRQISRADGRGELGAVICDDPRASLGLLGRVFGGDDKPAEVEVYKASPSLALQMVKKEEVKS
jgi:hypothetical protein